MSMSFGELKMVTDKMGNKKHESIIGKTVTYDRQYIEKGLRATFQCKGNDEEIHTYITSTVENVYEDCNGLTLYTRNSVFYIEK